MTPAEAAAAETARVYATVCYEYRTPTRLARDQHAADTHLNRVNAAITAGRHHTRRATITTPDPDVIDAAIRGRYAWDGLINPERTATIQALLQRGLTIRDIARHFGIGQNTARRYRPQPAPPSRRRRPPADPTRAAQLQAAAHATSPEDCRQLLDVLGLLEAAPTNATEVA